MSKESTNVSTMSDNSSPRNKQEKITKESVDTTMELMSNTQDFQEISTFPTFVDHTELIKVFYRENTSLFIAAPKGFGKSTNMNMIKRFFDITGNLDESLNKKVLKKRAQYKLFKNLKIVTEGNNYDLEEHLGMHPVIFVDFKGCSSSNLTDMYEFMFQRIKAAFTEHQIYLEEFFKKWKEGKVETRTGYELDIDEIDIRICYDWFNSKHFSGIESSETTLSLGLALLCHVLYYAYGNRLVVILIDEPDAVITPALKQFSYRHIEILFSTMNEFLCKTVHESTKIRKIHVILTTGISYMSTITKYSDAKLYPCLFLDDTDDNIVDRAHIIPFYGLNESDLDKLLDKSRKWKNLDDNGVATIKEKIDELFNGYRSKNGKQTIYPLYDVLSYLIREERSVPIMPPILLSLTNALMHNSIAANVMTLCGGGEIEIDPISHYGILYDDLIALRDFPRGSYNDIYFQLLMERGFLSHANTPASDKSKWKVRFVNETMKQKFIDVLRDDKIQLDKYLLGHVDACAQGFCKLRKYVLTGNRPSKFPEILRSLTKSFETLLGEFRRYALNEFSLKVLISLIMNRLLDNYNFGFCGYEQPITDKNGHSGKIDIWLVDEIRKFAILFIIKCGLEGSTVETSSLSAANEARGSVHRTKDVYYPAIFDVQDEKTGAFTRGAMVGLSVNENRLPSISIALRRNAAKGLERPYCFSATERQEYGHLRNFKEYIFYAAQFN